MHLDVDYIPNIQVKRSFFLFRPGISLIKTKNVFLEFMGWEELLNEEMATHSSILPWGIYGQTKLASYSPWSFKELDVTEHIHTHTYIYKHT